MKTHDISIKSKYFEPIREGKISLLIFDKKVLHEDQPGDFVLATKGSYEVKAKISRSYIKSFADITDEEAVRAGFLNKDFLKDELLSRFELTPMFSFDKGKNIDEEIFFLVEISPIDEEHYYINTPVKVNLYSKYYNTDLYNPEYDKIYWDE